MRAESFGEALWNGVGDAVADVREKYEEAVWGRAVTEPGEPPEWPQAHEQQQMQQETGMPTGEILPPEHDAHEEARWAELEHGTVLEGQAERIEDTPRLEWPQGRDMEQEREREQDIDLDR